MDELFKEEVQDEAVRLTERVKKLVGRLADHTTKKQMEIDQLRTEVTMLRHLADLRPARQPELQEVGQQEVASE